ncbi:hypothetical protein D3C79_936020 [compost metagenome]
MALIAQIALQNQGDLCFYLGLLAFTPADRLAVTSGHLGKQPTKVRLVNPQLALDNT